MLVKGFFKIAKVNFNMQMGLSQITFFVVSARQAAKFNFINKQII